MSKVSPKLTAKPGYKPQTEDTSAETDLFEFYLLRQWSNSDRFLMAQAQTQMTRRLSLSGLQYRFPELSGDAFARKVAQVFLGDRYHQDYTPQGDFMTWIQDSLALAAILHPIFEQAKIFYYITGGVAASTFGDPRSTRDLDIVLAVEAEQIDSLIMELEAREFYVPDTADVKSGRLNMIGITHIPTVSRADLVLAAGEEFDAIKFERRRLVQIVEVGSFYFASPEDVILNKLQWRQRSQSEQQWRDVLGVLKVQGESLNFEYLWHWAARLNLMEDLTQATIEAGLNSKG